MPKPQNFKRIRERLALGLPVRIRCHETTDREWTEITRLLEVTPFGAGFTLKRQIEKGRLLHMTIPMPRQLRVFDHAEDQYKVWGLVRYVIPYVKAPAAPVANQAQTWEVGVAFVGKKPPRSYRDDPSRRYEVSGTPENPSLVGDFEPAPAAGTERRSYTRHNMPIDMLIETLNDKGEVDLSEQTVSENISEKGAAIYSALPIPIGRFIRLTSAQYKISIYGAVRGKSTAPTGMPRIHVEFIDHDWPL